ncbi:NUDIX domain-containing protein [Halovivax gelatinilyticus]|uniref:NUDIX domain-containing protein n=1 Tax=Halovivax gelatinilyticus TaxID=2961597 RepID=UPI0020CA729E|nr:NUDIX hydrolase [Halovivax gelatinilyticus]
MVWTIGGSTPRYCPHCGVELRVRDVEGEPRPFCGECERTIYKNPLALSRVAVVDADSVLLIQRARGVDRGTWVLPGGYVDSNESLSDGAARELREETGLCANPDDLSLLGTGSLSFDDGHSLVSINYAVSRSATDGEVVAGSDAADARFFTRAEIESDPPHLRASGPLQVVEAIDEFGDP